MVTRVSVSVIVPTFNRAHFIGQALQSILKQVDRSDQVIVIDDGSTDNTADALKPFGDRIEIIEQSNAGIGAARNAGLARAARERIAFLDSDDLWTDRHQSTLNAVLDQSPDVAVAFGWASEFEDAQEGKPRHLLRTQPGLVCGAMLARREVFEAIGGFRTDVKLGEFIDWMARLQERQFVHHVVEQIVLLRRIHGGNTVLAHRERVRDYHAVLRESLARRDRAPGG